MQTRLALSLRNFRAFSETDTIEIRPLTLLVGENSTGKTSFLAALRFALSLSDREKRGYFNVYPFDLGSFDDIIYDNGGRRAKTFHIKVERDVDINDDATIYFRPRKGADVVRGVLEVEFCSNYGEVSINSFTFEFEQSKITYHRSSDRLFRFFVGGREVESKAPNPTIRTKRELRNSDLRQLTLAMLDEVFNVRTFAKREADASQRMVQAFDAFVNPNFSIHSSPPVRSIPKRVYTASDDTGGSEVQHAPYELNRVKRADRNRWARLNSGLNVYGKLSGLFTRFDVTKLTPQDSGPFQLKVKVRGRSSTIADVGYGVSQALPIMTDLIEASSGRNAFLFQQPEVHLHPRAQAALGSIFADFATSHPESIIVAETHSDYLIDRLRIAVREGSISAEKISILYFDPREEKIDIYQMTIDEQGNLGNTPRGYRDFFIHEQERVLGF